MSLFSKLRENNAKESAKEPERTAFTGRTPAEREKAGLPREGLKKNKVKANGEAGSVHELPQPKDNGELHKGEQKPADSADSFIVDGDVHDVWDRRVINPEQRERHIQLTRPGMHIRWINLANLGRYQRARYEEGWQPVPKAALQDEREIYGVSYTTEGWVCRGEKQQEMLMWMPEAVYKKIMKAKQRKVEESQKKIRDSIVQGGAKHINEKFGGGGEETVERMTAKQGTTGAFRGNISFGTEQVEPESEDLAGE